MSKHHEDLLISAANHQFAHKKPRSHNIFSCYRPSYRDNEKTPRYCNDSLKRWQFILIHILIISIIFMSISIPIMYFIIVPKIIRDKINSIDPNQIKLNKMHLDNFALQSLDYSVNAILPPQLPFPINAQIEPFILHIKSNDNKILASITMPKVQMKLNEDIGVDAAGQVDFSEADKQRIIDLVQQFSNEHGIEPQDVVGEASIEFGVWGLTLYRDFAVSRSFRIPNMKSNMKEIFDTMPSFLKAENFNSEMKAKYAMKDLINLSEDLPLVKIESLNVGMDDIGPNVDVVVTFENPSKLTVDLKGVEFGIAIDQVNVARVTVSDIILDNGMQTMGLVTKVRFEDPSIDASKIPKTISDCIQEVLFQKSPLFKVAIVGPVIIKGTVFAQEITSPLSLYLPMSDILQTFQIGELQDLMTSDGIKRVLSSSQFEAEVLSDKIVAPFSVGLKRLFPLPQEIVIPYFTSISIFGGEQHTITITLDALSISTNDDAMIIKSIGKVYPNNSEAAAVALGDIVNPLFYRTPQASEMQIRQVSFKAKEDGPVFLWSQKIFDSTSINFVIPENIITLDTVINIVTLDKTTIPLTVTDLAMNQLEQDPGFQVLGDIFVDYPQGIPKVSLNVGHVSMNPVIEDGVIAVVELPNGLVFTEKSNTKLDALMVLSDNDNFAQDVQAVVDSIFSDGASSVVGVTGLKFGPSKDSSFVTFSKIAINIDTGSLLPLLKSTIQAIQNKVLIPGLLKLDGVDMHLISSSDINAGASVSVNNPLPISAFFGSISAMGQLDGDILAKVGLSPLTLEKGLFSMETKMEVKLSNGDNGLAGKVSGFLNDFLALRSPGSSVSVTGLRLSPPKGGPGVIHHIEAVVFPIPVDVIRAINPLKPESSLDTSALFPNMATIINDLNLGIKAALLETLPQSSLGTGLDFSYNNPIPASVSIPFAIVQISIDDTAIFNMELKGLVLERISGEMDIGIVLRFNNGEAVADRIAALVSQYLKEQNLAGRKFNVQRVYFGSSKTDVNNLLSEVDLNVTPLVEKVNLVDLKEIIMKQIPINFPMSLSELQEKFSLKIGSSSVDTLPQKSLTVKSSASFQIPFPVTVNLGYMSTRVDLNRSPLVEFSLPNFAALPKGHANHLDIDASLRFIEHDSTPAQVARIVDNVIEGRMYDSSVDFSKMYIGASYQDKIDAFSKVSLDISLDDYLLPYGKIDIDGIVSKFVTEAINGLSDGKTSLFNLKDASFSVLPNKQAGVGLNANINLPLPFPVTLSIGYIGIAKFLLDEVNAVLCSLSGIKYNENKDFQLDSGLLNVQDTKELSEKLNSIFKLYMDNGVISARAGVAGIVLGVDSEDAIQCFRDISVSLALDPIVKPILELGTKYINEFIANLPALGKSILGENKNGIKIPLAHGLSITLNHADVAFNSNSVIGVGVKATLDFPFRIRAQVPYFTVKASLDAVLAVETQVVGFNIAGDGVNSLDLSTNLFIHESGALADKLALLSESVLNAKTASIPGNIVVSGVAVGTSSADTINAFQEIIISLSIDRFMGPIIRSVSASLDLFGLLDKFGVQLQGVEMLTLPGQSVQAKLGASFNIPFPVSVSIGYVSAMVSLEDAEVVQTQMKDLKLVGGANSFQISTLLVFPSTTNTQEKVASFVENLLTAGLGNTVEIFTASEFLIGHSETDHIKVLSKAKLGVSSATILNKKSMDFALGLVGMHYNDLTLDSLIKRALIVKGNIDGSKPGEFHLSAVSGLKDITFTGTASIGYADVSPIISNIPLADVSIPSIKMYTSSGNVLFDIFAITVPSEKEELKQLLSKIVKDLMDYEKIDGTVGANGLVFGVGPDDYIDTFANVNLNFDINPFIKPIKDKVMKYATDFIGGDDYTINRVHLGIPADETAGVEIDLTVRGLPDISVNLPFASADFTMFGGQMASASVIDFNFKDGRMTTTILTKMVVNPEVHEKMLLLTTDLVFWRDFLSRHISLYAACNNVHFGSSQSSSFSTISEVTVGMDITPMVLKAKSNIDVEEDSPINIKNIDCQLNYKGMDSYMVMTPMPKWLAFTTDIGGVLGHLGYRLKGEPQPIKIAEAYFHSINIIPGEALEMGVIIYPLYENHRLRGVLSDAVPKLLTWQHFSENATMGWVTVHENDPRPGSMRDDGIEPTPGKTISVSKDSIFDAPDLTFWEPFTVTKKALNVYKVGIVNKGPLNLDLGIFKFTYGVPGEEPVFKVETPGPIIVKSVSKGGLKFRSNPENLELTINGGITGLIDYGFSFINPMGSAKVQVVSMERPDGKKPGPIEWLNTCLEDFGLYIADNMAEIKEAALNSGHIRYENFGLDLDWMKNKVVGKITDGIEVVKDGVKKVKDAAISIKENVVDGVKRISDKAKQLGKKLKERIGLKRRSKSLYINAF